MIRRFSPTFERRSRSCRTQTGASRILFVTTLLIFCGLLGVPSSAIAAPDEVLGNKGVAYRLFDAVYNDGDLKAAESLFASDAVIHMTSGQLHGPSGCAEYVAMLKAGYPGATFAIDDTIVSGDTVVVQWSLSGIGGEDATAGDTPETGGWYVIVDEEGNAVVPEQGGGSADEDLSDVAVSQERRPMASPLFSSQASVDGVALLKIENYLIVELWMR